MEIFGGVDRAPGGALSNLSSNNENVGVFPIGAFPIGEKKHTIVGPI